MENKIVYVVGYEQGYYDENKEVILFVTTDEQKATNWCKKWNNLYERLEKHCLDTCRPHGWKYRDLGESFYYETELR